MIEYDIRECSVHGQIKFAKHKNGNSTSVFRCMKCSAAAVQRNVDAKRERAYVEFGCSCVLCGYDKCRTALEWHHLNPEEKEINPSKVFSRSWDKIVKELSKCVLLCANCHREVHAGLKEVKAGMVFNG